MNLFLFLSYSFFLSFFLSDSQGSYLLDVPSMGYIDPFSLLIGIITYVKQN